jgi:1,4-alpha-glucan branching enzyme
VFKLKGFLTTKQVILTGSFNNWDEKAIRMKRTADGWEMHMTLPPGEYEYKFIADGKWMEDPANPVKKHNEYGTYNSVINLNKSVRFFLAGFTTAKEVILAGSFNNWDTHQIKMRRTGPGWTYEMSLGRGKHQYKFIVDGQWIVDPVNPRKESDLHGNENSVLLVH